MKDNILNMAVIGCSGMGQRHIEAVLDSCYTSLYAVCDNDPDRMAEARDRYHPVRAVTDYRELVNDPELDAVVLVVPDNFHMEMTVAFLEAGKDVLCEKPMALTMAECEAMLEAERRTGRKLMVGQVGRHTPSYVRIKELVEEGRIGELYYVEGEYAHNYSVARGHRDWRVTPERNGFIGGGCHSVYLLSWIAGFPEEAFAYSNHKCLTDWPADDATVALYKFPNGVMGKVFASIGCCRDYTMRTAVYGTKGTIIFDNKDEILLYESVDGEHRSYLEPKHIEIKINDHNVGEEVHEFAHSILTGSPLPVTSMEGAMTVAACCAAIESARTGQPVQIQYPE